MVIKNVRYGGDEDRFKDLYTCCLSKTVVLL